MNWLCWTAGYENTPRKIEAASAEDAAEKYASWYDQDRCDGKFAREGGTLPIYVVAEDPVVIYVKCSVTYAYTGGR